MTDASLEPLVRGTLERKPKAWQAFWLAVDGRMEEIAGRWWVLGRLSRDVDERREVVLQVMDRLEANGFERLGLLHGVLLRGEELGWPWMSAVTRRTALNHRRAHTRKRTVATGDEGRRLAAELPLADGLDEHLPESARVPQVAEARRIQAYAERELKPHQWHALRLWHAGFTREEIAKHLGLADEDAVRRAVDAAIHHLRYAFAREGALEKEK